MVAAHVKKIDPTKKTTAAAVGDREVSRLMGTPAAKQADPTAKSHPIQRMARSDGEGTAQIVGPDTFLTRQAFKTASRATDE
jgi:hypothetical protein